MTSTPISQALVLGVDPSGDAAAALLRERGTTVVQVPAGTPQPPDDRWPELVVVSALTSGPQPLAQAAAARGIRVVGERELAFQHSLCLHVAVTGGSGKSTTTGLIAHLLRGCGRRVEIAGTAAQPACAHVEATRDLDFLVHAVEPAELAYLQAFRPVVGVVLNAPSDHPGTSATRDDAARRWARLFAVQQAFDWAIVQTEALAHLHAVGVEVPGKLITFSATSRQADLQADRGLLVSRLEGWSGPLWDMARGRMTGLHFAEDALAALAVGRVLRLPLEQMVQSLATFVPGPGRFELLGEAGGVRFVDDHRAANLDALGRALTTLAPTPDQPTVWLVAGGDSGGRQFYDLGPVLSPRVKQALLFGEAADAMRRAWSLFAPCQLATSASQAIERALAGAGPGDVVLFSPGCPSRAPLTGAAAVSRVFREAVMRRLSEAPAPTVAGTPPPTPDR